VLEVDQIGVDHAEGLAREPDLPDVAAVTMPLG
jgi:hypothetical protein